MIVRLALDWTPNTIHTGIYVAQAQGLYQKSGMDLFILSPDQDNYSITPAKKVASGIADLAIGPSESAVSFQTLAKPSPLKCVAALLAKDASAIVTTEASGLDSPSKLEGKKYGSYDARFEELIIRHMIANDGGKGHIEAATPPKLSMLDNLLAGDIDATWVFLPWEELDAEEKGHKLNTFKLAGHGVPYGYSPTLIAHDLYATNNGTKLRKFIEATEAGYKFAVENPEEAADMLIETSGHPSLQGRRDFVVKSQKAINEYTLHDDGSWGRMDEQRWKAFVDWMNEQNVVRDAEGNPIEGLEADRYYTNHLFEEAQASV